MAGFVSPALLEQIRAANDIVDVISAVVPLKRAGASFTALCPFHREKTPSFHVNPRKQTFHCFGCHKGGDVFTFVREYESLDFPEAVKRLADRARIPLEFENEPQYKEKQFLKDKLYEINEQITARWHACLLNDAAGAAARAYIEERAVSPDAVKLFRLGYSPDSWDDTVNWAKSKGYDLPLVEQAGLLVRKEESSQYYGRFRGRLMFPICDEQGRVIGFSARVLPGSDDPRKYVNSPETPLFIKSRVMFGLDKSKRAILEKQSVIVCEGQLDLISIFMSGVQNVVAPQGTAFTKEHAHILKKYTKDVVLCFDSDEAGQKATVRVLDDLLAMELSIRVAAVPAPHDPDSFIKEHGGPAFEELTRKAEGFFEYYLNRLCQINDIRTDRGQHVVLRAMAEAVGKANDRALFDRYAQRTAARLGLNALSAQQAFARALKAPSTARTEEQVPDEAQEENWRPPQHELWLLKIILGHDELLPWARSHLHPEWVQNRYARQILEERLAADDLGNFAEAAAILVRLEDPRARSLLTEALVEDRPIPKPELQLADLVTRLRNESIDKELAGITQQLGLPGLSPEDATRLVREQMDLRAAKRIPLVPLHGH